jgi:hypothetical protein
MEWSYLGSVRFTQGQTVLCAHWITGPDMITNTKIPVPFGKVLPVVQPGLLYRALYIPIHTPNVSRFSTGIRK